jgi:predicted MFS family arabinose efflux permease
LVNLIGEPGGYQFNLGLAFIFGTVSLYFYSRVPERRPAPVTDRLSTRQVLRQMTHMPTFLHFVVAHTVMFAGVMLAGPFINVYMAEKARFSVGTIGLVTTAGTLATLVSMRLMGPVHERFGMIKTMRLGFGVPLLPVLWLWVHHPWQAYLVNGAAALSWAGYNLGSFNLLLAATPDDHRPRYIAAYTTIVSIASGIAPVLGGALLDKMGFTFLFTMSGIVRGIGFVMFLVLVREPEIPSE